MSESCVRENRMHSSMRRREAATASRASTRRAAEEASRRPYNLDYTTRHYDRLHDIVKDVDWARVLVGFLPQLRLQGSALGRKVGRYVVDHLFQPLG
jgi:hypothetical protein